ncbi:MAG TPA: patatin-like phospholipase family protein [Planctomycetota bacterium]|nr:patatin-like phospholipase family protein [Planctomycetota bacterium]
MRPPLIARNAAVLLVSVLSVACVNRPRVSLDTRAPTAAEAKAGMDTFVRGRAAGAVNVLALSGGGQNGAFGAGVLRGWRDAGRPRFDVVTGISTGALQASHAFIDTPEADAELERVLTGVRQHDIFCVRPVPSIPFETSVADFAPLARLLGRVLDDATIDRVAAASEGGRRLLLVGTANLDSGRMAVWDLGAIARRRDYATYRAILLAAASPPVAAEPVSLGGELHADGTLLGNVFVPDTEAREEAKGAVEGPEGAGIGVARRRYYVVYNSLLDPGPEHVELGLLGIASRSLGLLTTTAGHGSLWYLYGVAHKRGHEFRYVRIPERLRREADDPLAFDPARMRALYDAGVLAGRDPASWGTEPPPMMQDDGGPR